MTTPSLQVRVNYTHAQRRGHFSRQTPLSLPPSRALLRSRARSSLQLVSSTCDRESAQQQVLRGVLDRYVEPTADSPDAYYPVCCTGAMVAGHRFQHIRATLDPYLAAPTMTARIQICAVLTGAAKTGHS